MVNFKRLNCQVDGHLPLQDNASDGVAGNEKKCQVAVFPHLAFFVRIIL